MKAKRGGQLKAVTTTSTEIQKASDVVATAYSVIPEQRKELVSRCAEDIYRILLNDTNHIASTVVLPLHKYIEHWRNYVLSTGLQIGTDIIESYAVPNLIYPSQPNTMVGQKVVLHRLLGTRMSPQDAKDIATLDRLRQALAVRTKDKTQADFGANLVLETWQRERWTNEARNRAIDHAIREMEFAGSIVAPFLLHTHVGVVTRTLSATTATARLGTMYYDELLVTAYATVYPPPFFDAHVAQFANLKFYDTFVPYDTRLSFHENIVLGAHLALEVNE